MKKTYIKILALMLLILALGKFNSQVEQQVAISLFISLVTEKLKKLDVL